MNIFIGQKWTRFSRLSGLSITRTVVDIGTRFVVMEGGKGVFYPVELERLSNSNPHADVVYTEVP